jgi:uncharacterized protein YegP (UPF0339 family)
VDEMAKYIIRKDSKGEYYWLLWSTKNRETVARSSESYASKQGAKKSILWTQTNAKTTDIDDET